MYLCPVRVQISEISGIKFVKVPRSSFRMRHSTVQRSSERVQLISEGAAQLLWCSAAQIGWSVTQLNAAYLRGTALLNRVHVRRVQDSSVRCSVAQQGAALPNGPEFGPKEKFWRVNKKQRSCDGRGARSAPFAMVLSPKRRVRAAHGRARAAKTHQYFMFTQNQNIRSHILLVNTDLIIFLIFANYATANFFPASLIVGKQQLYTVYTICFCWRIYSILFIFSRLISYHHLLYLLPCLVIRIVTFHRTA